MEIQVSKDDIEEKEVDDFGRISVGRPLKNHRIEIAILSKELIKCEVDGCEEDPQAEIEQERPGENIEVKGVCHEHYEDHQKIREEFGRFHTVLNEKHREKLREDE